MKYQREQLSKPPSALPTVVDAISAGVMARVGTLPNARMNDELAEIVRLLRIGAADTETDLSTAPALEVIDAEDGSVLIEWHLVDRRLGFNVEPREGESGWYYAFSKDSEGQCGSGLLTSLDMKTLLHLMFTKRSAR